MSYYLTDPYHYTPKCYPFLNTKWQPYKSNRITNLGRQIEEASAISRLNLSHSVHKQNQRCDIALLRCKYMVEDLPRHTSKDDRFDRVQDSRNQLLAVVEGSRKAKEGNLRKFSRELPLFTGYARGKKYKLENYHGFN